MDPDENLKEQLELAWSITESVDEHSSQEARDGSRLAHLVISLHQWIIDGGFLPKQWKR